MKLHSKLSIRFSEIVVGLLFTSLVFSPLLVAASLNTSASIVIDAINGKDPSSYSCVPGNRLENPVFVTGHGNGDARRQILDDYHVGIDWGDGDLDENVPARFHPAVPSESEFGAFEFTFTAGPHNYRTDGDKYITVKLYHKNHLEYDVIVDAKVHVQICKQEPEDGTLIVYKKVKNNNGGTLASSDFTLHVIGNQPSLDAFPGSASGTTIKIAPGHYEITEDQVLGYHGLFVGDCSGEIAAGEEKTCMVMNHDLKPKLTVNKVVINDDGGRATIEDFELYVNRTDVESGQTYRFNVGTYRVHETNTKQYAPTFSGDCDEEGNVILNLGDKKTCTITNNDIAPRLTVTKVVVNDDGGTAQVSDFPLFVDGNSVTSGQEITLLAGNHQITETNQDGYVGTFSGDCNAKGRTRLIPGEVKSCILTNNDEPGIPPETATLIVKKHVVNDNGGSNAAADFTMTVNGTNVSQSDFPGNEDGTTVTLSPGSYSVDEEENLLGYTKSTEGDCAGTIAADETKTCVIVNDDIQPKLTVVKEVINDNEGTAQASDFTLTVSGTNASPDSFPGNSEGTLVSLDAGEYGVAENEAQGYTTTLSENCSGTIGVGEEKTCVVTNDDEEIVIPPQAENTQQLCADGIDNDGDELIDAADPDCAPFQGGGDDGGNTGGGGGSVGVPAGGGSFTYYSLAVNNGSEETTSVNVTLTLSATGAYEMMISNTPDFAGGAWELYATSKPWILASGNGVKTVYAQFRSQGGTVVGNASDGITLTGQVLGATTEGKVLGESIACDQNALLISYIKPGAQNDAGEVKKLQGILNNLGYGPLPLTGLYGTLTQGAVKKFQVDNAKEVLTPWVPYGLSDTQIGTGYVYKTTKRWLNMKACPELNLPLPELP